MTTLDKILQQQQPRGLTVVHPGEAPKDFALKLNELQREIQHLQAACMRLQNVNRRLASRYSPGIRVVEDPVIKELATLQGWLLSAVESYFGLVWSEMGSDELDAVQRAWKRLL